MKNTTTIAISILITLMAGCAGPTTQRIKPNDAAVEIEAKKQKELALEEHLRMQKRLNRIGYTILKAGLPLCVDRKAESVGIKYATKFDFDEEFQDVVVSKLDLGKTLRVIYVVQSSPAEIAGFEEGDILLSVNDIEAPIGKEASKKFTEILKKETKENKNLSFKITRDGINKTININTLEVCNYPLILTDDDSVNAYADGNSIYITQGMMDFASTDDELALVIGHELAHNSMRHIDAKRLNAMGGFFLDMLLLVLTGVDSGGAFSSVGAQAYSQEFESEADYVGLYFVERAGYEINDAAYFWRRMGVKHPSSIAKNHAASHPSPPERFVSIEDTIKEINQKINVGTKLLPNIDESALSKRDIPPAPKIKL